jgi:periplasmic divalent cation tolerance protein
VSVDSGKVVVFVTTSSEEEAEKIASLLLEQRKAACVSVIPRSIPGSGGRGTGFGPESLLIIKTRAALVPQLTDIVKKAHSYTSRR